MLLQIAAYFLFVNLLAVLMFAVDKARSRSKGWRVPESRLLLVALFGGTVGAIAAQRFLRHKTFKEPFRTRLNAIAALQAIMLVAMSIPASRDYLWALISGVAGRSL